MTYLLEALKPVYQVDAEAKQQDLSAHQRLHSHQKRSGPVMAELPRWLQSPFDQKKVEPNGSLGLAITYLLRHWEKLTLYLRVSAAPLDNKLCERALKTAILHRKNASFYKSPNGARVGDLCMSLIYTCELGGLNPFDYLTELHRHADRLAASPRQWMPWNYRQARDGIATAPIAAGRSSASFSPRAASAKIKIKILHACRKDTANPHCPQEAMTHVTPHRAMGARKSHSHLVGGKKLYPEPVVAISR